MKAARSSPATGGSGRLRTAVARLRNRSSMASTSSSSAIVHLRSYELIGRRSSRDLRRASVAPEPIREQSQQQRNDEETRYHERNDRACVVVVLDVLRRARGRIARPGHEQWSPVRRG